MPRIKHYTCKGAGEHDTGVADWLTCSNCSTVACDFHGDHSVEDEEWLCAACFEAERERLAATA